MFGVDLRTPTEAALLPLSPLEPCDVEDYREELVLSLSSARELAAQAIQQAQRKYKALYDRKASERRYRVGDWVLVKFPQEESGKQRKLSRPWHGPYRVLTCNDLDFTVSKVYFSQHGSIKVHQSRVAPCPAGFPSGYYWYGARRHSPGRPPKWVRNLLQDGTREEPPTLDAGGDCGPSVEVPEVSTPGTNDDESELDADLED